MSKLVIFLRSVLLNTVLQLTFSSVISASTIFLLIYAQAHYCLSGCDTSDSYGKKLLLFLKWKCMEAKVV